MLSFFFQVIHMYTYLNSEFNLLGSTSVKKTPTYFVNWFENFRKSLLRLVSHEGRANFNFFLSKRYTWYILIRLLDITWICSYTVSSQELCYSWTTTRQNPLQGWDDSTWRLQGCFGSSEGGMWVSPSSDRILWPLSEYGTHISIAIFYIKLLQQLDVLCNAQ